MCVGVVGLGHMGHAFAMNLAEDGYRVFAYDRNPARAQALTGAHPAVRLADLAPCNAVLTSLPDDDALAEVALGTEGLVNVLAAGAIRISTSTVSPTISRHVAAEHHPAGKATLRHRCSEIRISQGNASFLCSPPADGRRWTEPVRCWSASASASLASATMLDWLTWSSSPPTR